MKQKRIIDRETQDEHTNRIILKMIDSQIETATIRKESLERQTKESLERQTKEHWMEIKQLNYQRKILLKDGWKKAIKPSCKTENLEGKK